MKISHNTQKTAFDKDLPILPPVVLARLPIGVLLMAPATSMPAIFDDSPAWQKCQML